MSGKSTRPESSYALGGARRGLNRAACAATVIAALLVAAAGTAAEPDATGDKEIIARVITDSIAWALTKDRPLQESTMAHDPDLFYYWVDSKSTIIGWDRHEALFELFMDPRFKATHTEVRNLRVTLSRSGDVAWYSAMLDDLGEWDGRPVGARDIRWTGVLEKREDRWVIVQMHASLASDTVREQALEQAHHGEAEDAAPAEESRDSG